MATCKSCGAEIWFVKMTTGGTMPLDMKPEKRVRVPGVHPEDEPVGEVVTVYTPHWASCPSADQHRRRKS